MFKRILVPTDGSDITAHAVDTAIQLAKVHGAQLLTLSVMEPFPYSAVSEIQPVPPQEFIDAQLRVATQRVEAVSASAAAAGLSCKGCTVEALHAWEAIVDHAKAENVDLIVMASHGRKGFAALLLGSEAQKVLTHIETPVLIVK
ncbi:nucleotide-binding universal stress UspA family protein [Pelomonas saccharophila]|uniref:Nucleotide-binding universal stress UspA family protein n=1 Tax=Roseateles saccharophilus TaxID=304 RepID=A0ABU1YI90_ROSSA|nr:universal stress protein [Roseateles saccharophilus]MDR7268554.1 nucleotide-binding universal stress UspA family protein [Roseateles saccharophilus]